MGSVPSYSQLSLPEKTINLTPASFPSFQVPTPHLSSFRAPEVSLLL